VDAPLDGGVLVKLFDTIKLDLREMAVIKAVPYPNPRSLMDILLLPGTWAVINFRISSALHHSGLRPFSRLLYFANVVLFSFDVAPSTQIGPGLAVPHPMGVAIDSRARLGARNRVLRSVAIGGSADPTKKGALTSGDDVWFMDSCQVFGPVTIGHRSIIGASAIVTTDVPPDMFVFGQRSAKEMRSLSDIGLSDHFLRDTQWQLVENRDLDQPATGAKIA
jgi:serine O-acetyltransferase